MFQETERLKFLKTPSPGSIYQFYVFQAEDLICGSLSYNEIEHDLHKWLFSGTSAIAGVYIQVQFS